MNKQLSNTVRRFAIVMDAEKADFALHTRL